MAKVSKQLPKSMIKGNGLSIQKLLSVTDTLRKRGARNVIIKGFKWLMTKNGLIVAKAVITSETRRGQLTHETWVTFLTDKTRQSIAPKSKVMVQCSCEDYTYTWEYANAEYGAARIFYCNGEPPDEKNPKHSPGLCKHAYRLCETLILT